MIIVLRLRLSGLKETKMVHHVYVFVLSGLVVGLGLVNTLCFGDFALNIACERL